MSWGGSSSSKTPVPELADSESLSTSQEAVPVPFMVGERRIALSWITDIYNQYAVESESEGTSKK